MSLLAALALASAAAGPIDTARSHLSAQYPGLDLEDARAIEWAAGTIVRFTPRIAGIAVENRQLAVSVDPKGLVRRVRGRADWTRGLDARPRVERDIAIGNVSRLARLAVGSGELWPARAELKVFVDKQDEPHLAWAVDVSTAAPVSTWRVLVDAHTGELLRTKKTMFDARGNIFPSNPDASALLEVELPGLTSDTELLGTYATVFSCDTWEEVELSTGTCTASSRHAVPDANGDYLFASDPTSGDDPLAEVQMYYHVDLVSDWFEQTQGFSHGFPLKGLVNFEMDNAFFGDADGDGVGDIAFGQNALIDFAYDADVIYHEYVHSVIGSLTELGYFVTDELGVDTAPLALNEGSADLFSVALTGDPLLGEYAGGGLTGEAIRDLGPDHRCPLDLYGEPHEDGLIWGSLGWNMMEDPLLGPEVVADLVYGTVAQWGSVISWSDAGHSLLDTAADMEAAGLISTAQLDAITTHTTDHGVPDCARIIALDDGAEVRHATVYAGIMDSVGYVPTISQFSLEAPEGTGELVLHLTDFDPLGADMAWRIYVRRGEPIRFSSTNIMGFEVPVVEEYDFFKGGKKANFDFVVDRDSEVPLQPGATYYFSVGARNGGTISAFDAFFGEVSISGSAGPGSPDPDPVVAEEEPGGCGCAASPAPVGWLALPLLLALRRRG